MQAPREGIRRYVEGKFPGASVRRLRGDASTRGFHRVEAAVGSTWVLMDYGRPFSGETDDVRLNRIFREAGLPVAEILDVSEEAGCILLEDLGDETLEARIRSAADIIVWLERAVDLAVDVVTRGTPGLARSERAAGPALDEERFRFEMDFFLEHFGGNLRKLHPIPQELTRELHDLADLTARSSARVFCHRDFHTRNLMVRSDGSLAMVDLQDARWGPDSYDLASLLRDAYVEFDDGEVGPLVERYRESLADPPAAEEFRRRFDLVSAQRMIKALGTFGYQATTRGEDRFLEGVPRTLRRLNLVLPERPETATLFRLLQDSGLLE